MWENASVVTSNVLQWAMWWRSQELVILESSKAISECHNKNKIFCKKNDYIFSDPTDVADIFNTYFVNTADCVGNGIDGKISFTS